jgi:hypothetical protein
MVAFQGSKQAEQGSGIRTFAIEPLPTIPHGSIHTTVVQPCKVMPDSNSVQTPRLSVRSGVDGVYRDNDAHHDPLYSICQVSILKDQDGGLATQLVAVGDQVPGC